jgi:hypothetical protein
MKRYVLNVVRRITRAYRDFTGVEDAEALSATQVIAQQWIGCPCACPYCNTVGASAYDVSSRLGLIHRCDNCGRQWSAVAPDKTIQETI